MYLLQKAPSLTDHYLGNLHAPFKLVEYGDYECPHSSKARIWIHQLRKEFGDSLCFIYRHFPLIDIHPNSVFAAITSEAASTQGKFWRMHEALSRNYHQLSTSLIMKLAGSIGLDQDRYLLDIDRQDLAEKISEDMLTGEISGVTSTPAFFINGIRLEGPISLEILRSSIKSTHLNW